MDTEKTERALVSLTTVYSEARTASGGQDVMASIERHPAWELIADLPLCLSSGIPLPRFKVRDLLKLRKGSIVQSEWQSSADVPLSIQKVETAWCEFEVVEQKVSVRITRLA